MGRVLGNRSAEEIVDTEEIQDEIIPVDMPHDAVPGSSDESKEDEAGNQVDMEHFTDVLLIEKEEDASKTREKDSNRSLCQCRKSGCHIAEVVVLPVFCISQIEEGDSSAHEEVERGIRDDGFGKDPCFYGNTEDQGGEPADLFSVYFSGEPVSKEKGRRAHDGSREARSCFVESEDGKGRCQFPVVENWLVIPETAVNLRGNPVAGQDHLAGCFRIIGFCRIRDGQKVVSCQIQDKRQDEQHRIGMTANEFGHEAPPKDTIAGRSGAYHTAGHTERKNNHRHGKGLSALFPKFFYTKHTWRSSRK